MNLKDLIKGIFKKGIRIGYSSGPAFDPRDQERTDPMDDFIKQKEREVKNERGNK